MKSSNISQQAYGDKFKTAILFVIAREWKMPVCCY